MLSIQYGTKHHGMMALIFDGIKKLLASQTINTFDWPNLTIQCYLMQLKLMWLAG